MGGVSGFRFQVSSFMFGKLIRENPPSFPPSSSKLAENLQVMPVSARVAATENALPRTFRGDPADRIIAATAIVHQLILLTPDPETAFHHVCETICYPWPRR
jgi:PIN domain nuclease of toxin-antitoxin system